MRTPDPRIHVGRAANKPSMAGSSLITPGHDGLRLSTSSERLEVRQRRQAPTERRPAPHFPSADGDPAQGSPLPARAAAASAAGYAAGAGSPAHAAAAASAASYGAACAASYGAACAAANGAACAAACGGAASCGAASAASATAAGSGKLQALAEVGVFPVEDIERRQADVRDFLLTEKDDGRPCGVLRRYIRRRRSC